VLINAPADKGTAATVHPNAENGTACTTGDPLSPSNGDYGDFTSGFTMDFKYSFDTSRGDGQTGWVKIIQSGNARYKISNVGNSGVKFGGVEAAILDVKSMAAKAGGLATLQSYVTADGDVDFPDTLNPTYETEPVNKLMTGVLYGGDYFSMTDLPATASPPTITQAEYQATLGNNWNRDNAEMTIDVTQTSSDPNGPDEYKIIIYVDGAKTYEQTDVSLESLNTLSLQTHWGSGVVFSDMSITKK